MKEHAVRHTHQTNFILISLLVAIALFVCQPANAQVQTGTDTAFGIAAFQSGQGNYDTAIGSFVLGQNLTGGDNNTAVGYTAMYWNTTGIGNTATGVQSLNQNRTGYWNTATGFNSLISNTTGSNNTASGIDALACNFTGSWNTASGAFALGGGTFNFVEPFPACAAGHAYYGNGNTATGAQALLTNTIGNNNTASGYGSLYSNTTAAENTATGYNSLYANTTGNKNTASGALALISNTTGSYNTASGYEALYYNIDGIRNSASGDWGLYSNTHGSDNTASGQAALYSNTVGSNNIGLGANAGYNVTSGSNNIEIGSEGSSSDGGTIRIGTAGTQTATYIAGIENAKVTGAAVYVTSSGQLGVLASSERYKTAIAPMGAGTEKLSDLRPASFHLKTDANGPVQYGLIAEEVAQVYPELVIRNAAGKIQGVRYDELAPMLLNEVQKQQQRIAAQDAQAVTQAAEIRELKQQQKQFSTQAELNDLKQQLQAALNALRSKDQLVAQR
jgi:trimeric autotransporter adhesin